MGIVKKRVQVTTKDGLAIEGVLIRKRPEFVIEHPDLHVEAPEGGDPEKVQLQGRAVILRENISYIQVLR